MLIVMRRCTHRRECSRYFVTQRSSGWGKEEVGGAFAIAGAEAWHGTKALLSQTVGDAALQPLVGKPPGDFGQAGFLQQVVHVPVQFLATSEVPAYPGRDATEGRAYVCVPAWTELYRAQAAHCDDGRVVQFNEEGVCAWACGQWRVRVLHSERENRVTVDTPESTDSSLRFAAFRMT